MSLPMLTNGSSTSITGKESLRIPVVGNRGFSKHRGRRKSVRFSEKREFLRSLHKLVKWWPLLLFLPAVCLLAFQLSRSITVYDMVEKSEIQSESRKQDNLNMMEYRTRKVNGIRERCLKLLPWEQLQHLEVPPARISGSINVTYISSSTSLVGNEIVTENAEATRFNLFTGYQTLEEREQSYKVNVSTVVHCGFYSENGGFKISTEDIKFMHSCEVVVSTCAFGGGDDLYQPIGIAEASLKKVCFVAFWDEVTFKAQEAEGHSIGENHMIGLWRVVLVRQLPFSDQRLNGKVPKMLGHQLFPRARYSIWVDSKSQLRRDPLGILEALLWRVNSVLAISEHGARSNIYDEARAIVNKHKATPEEVEVQLAQYHHDGLPHDKRLFNGKKALAEASIIVREHTGMTNLFMCLWFNEVVRFTSRDQLSFPYVLWRLEILEKVNMFPVCTRKDLVNSMGHRRKVKPLVV